MRLRGLLLCAAIGSSTAFSQSAASLEVDPPVVQSCTGGLGRVTLRWRNAGVVVQVRAGEGRVPMTGWEGPAGEVMTGDWVGDGMPFFLVNQSGVVLASARARLACGTEPDPAFAGLASASYWPLHVGNRWTYTYKSRFITGEFHTWRVSRNEDFGGDQWAVIAIEADGQLRNELRVRVDSEGRIWQRRADGSIQLWIDPRLAPDANAALKPSQRLRFFDTPMGRFPDAVVATGPIVPPVVQSVVLVRGIGIASQENTMLSGSSGGFTDGLELVEARIGSYLYLTSPAPTLEISIESPVIDVSGGRARNCAVPCYFVACGLVPGTDPPGTYKPCTSASVRARSPAGNEVALEFLNPSGNVLDRIVTPSPAAGELALTHRVLLYAAPTVPHPPGLYRVRAILMNSAGAIDRTAELSLELK